MEELNNKILKIAYKMRPNINRPMMCEKEKSERIDLLTCAIITKYDNNKKIEEILKDMNIVQDVTVLEKDYLTTDQVEE
jgi:hypothetical protein